MATKKATPKKNTLVKRSSCHDAEVKVVKGDDGKPIDVCMQCREVCLPITEKPKNIPKQRGPNGGARPGAGRKEGGFNQRTLQRLTAKRNFVQRIISNTDKLFNAQLNKAIGERFLMVKRTQRDSKGKIKKEFHEIVTDPQVILNYLDGELKGGTSISDEDNFYYLTTRSADNQAISNMLDRAFGRATEKVELGASDEGDMSELTDEELNAKINRYLERRTAK